MGLLVGLMKELSFGLQLASMKDIIMASLMIHLMASHCDENTELQWDLQMEIQMDFNMCWMKELTWILTMAPQIGIVMENLMVD